MLTDAEIMAQVLAAFAEEQAEHRQAIGELLLELERNPEHPQRQTMLDQLFREAHSLKGGARAAGQHAAEQIAHRIEDVFSGVRKGVLALTPELCDPIYASLDAIGVLVAQVIGGGVPQIEPYLPLLEALGRSVERGQPAPADASEGRGAPPRSEIPPAAAVAAPMDDDAAGAPRDMSPRGAAPPEHASPAPASAPATTASSPFVASELPDASSTTVRLATATLDGLLNEAGELMTCTMRARQQSREAQAIADLPARWRRVWRQAHTAVARLRASTPALRPTIHHLDDRIEALPGAGRQAPGQSSFYHPASAFFDRDIASAIDALDQANALISELESRLATFARQASTDHARLAAVTDRLHDQVRRTRMLPLTTILNPLRLQMREMARAAGKVVTFEIDDGGAEADRQVLERLREVLLHLLRNAIDHGIETPAERLASGKAEPGRISLQAAVSGDHLSIILQDDGAGLDMAAIKARAQAGGLLNETDLARMSEAEISDLIFLPGFSTRQSVSELSGRGVGLDIVRSHVERMHGRVTVHSAPGAGCAFTLSVPLSLTSSHGLLLGVGDASYVLPLDSVHRIVQIASQDVRVLEGRTALVLDERPIPLVALADLLGEGIEGGKRAGGYSRLALLLGSGERQIACMVDAVLGEQELVVHRLPAPLQRVRFLGGATVLVDGTVVPILDVVDIVRAAIGARRAVLIDPEPAARQHTPTVLVVDDSITTRTLEKNILEAAGYKVCLATDGVEALEMLRHLADDGGCDLLLSDIDMPRLNGFDLTAQVRADNRLQRLPIVLVTSLDTGADRERGIAAGADAYIVKRSFEQQALLETIARLI